MNKESDVIKKGKVSFNKKKTFDGDFQYGKVPPQAVDLEEAVIG